MTTTRGAMAPDPDKFTISIVCDDPRHSEPRPVTNFEFVPEGARDGLPSVENREPGREMVFTNLPEADVPEDPSDRHWMEIPTGGLLGAYAAKHLVISRTTVSVGGDHVSLTNRTIYVLECRKCDTSHRWRPATLFQALDAAHAAHARKHGPVGVLRLPLSGIAAIVQHMSQAGD